MNIALALHPPVQLGELVEEALAEVGTQVELTRPTAAIKASVMEFIGQRLETYGREQGAAHDMVEAVLSVGFDDMPGAMARLDALYGKGIEGDRLGHFMGQHNVAEAAKKAAVAGARAANIVRGFEGGEVDPSLFDPDYPAERQLWEAYQTRATNR